MSKSVKIRRGTSLDHQQFTGAEGEITVDVTLDTLRVHDGTTVGGYPLLNTVKNAEITAPEFKANKILYKNSYTSLNDLPTASTYPGMLAYVQSESKAYISNGTTWVSFTQPSDLTSFVVGSANTSNTGLDFGITAPKVGTNLTFKTLRQGNNITLSSDATSVTIASANYSGANVQDSSGGFEVYKATDGTILQFRTIRPGTGLTMTTSVSGNEINIDTPLKQAYNTVAIDSTTIPTNAVNNTITFTSGNGISLTPNVVTKTVNVAVNLTATNNSTQSGSDVLGSYSAGTFTFNKITGGTGITLTTGPNGEINIDNDYAGTVTGATQMTPPSPTALAVFNDVTGAGVLRFFNLAAGDGISLTNDGNSVVITATAGAGGGGAGVGIINTGDFESLAFYPGPGTVLSGTSSAVKYDTANELLIADIDGTVSDISNHTTDALSEGSNNFYWTQTRFNTAFGLKTTGDLAEGGLNQYFTNERAQDAVSTMLQLGNPSLTSTTITTTAVSTSIATVTVANTSGITSGMTVTGAGFGAGVTVQSVQNSTTFLVSPAIFAPTGTSITLTGATTLIINTTANTTSSATLVVDSTAGVTNGQVVTGTGITGLVTVQSVTNATSLVVTPGYSVSVTLGTALSVRSLSTTGVLSSYNDASNTYTYSLDFNYLNQQVRNSISVIAGQGLSYDPVSGRFGLSGAVTSVNGFSGAVTLNVGDITGAAPIASPTLTGTPRAPTPTAASVATQIATKDYVDQAKLSVTGNPLSGLSTLQALGNAINGDTLFYQTVNTGLNSKLNISGGTINGSLLLNYTVSSSSDALLAVNKQYVDGVALVQTVNSKQGNVVLVTDDIAERVSPAATRLYFTNARARSSISLTSGDTDILSYNISTGAFTFTMPDTDKINEGTNQYWTAARSRGAMGINVTGNVGFASYDSATGVYTINASADNLSSGVTNRFYDDSLARAAITLNTSSSQAQLLTYNTATGQFTVAANTSNVPEGAAGPYYFTGARVNSALAVSVTQLNTVAASQSLVSAYNPGTGVTTFTFNANTNSITEGSNNLYYTDTRARSAISLSSDDTTVLSYSAGTGAFTFNKPNTTKIAEGTNLYFTDARARLAMGVLVTQSTGQSIANALTYDSSTGVYTLNANIDNFADGATNKFASIARVAAIISLNTTTADGALPGALIDYNNTTGAFSFNNSTDSLREGTQNKWASDTTVRGKITATSTTPTVGTSQFALRYGGSSGIAGTNAVTAGDINLAFYTSPSIVWTPQADGNTTFHLATAQDITTTATPKFKYVTTAVNPTNAGAGGRLAISSGVVTINCSVGNFHSVERNANVSQISITNVPDTGQYFEITIEFYTSSNGLSFTNSNTAVKFAGGSPPTMSTTIGHRDIFTFYTINGTDFYEKCRSLAVR